MPRSPRAAILRNACLFVGALVFFLSRCAVVSGERHISLSAVHSCIVTSNQTIGCSGDNTFNQSATQTGPFCGVSVGDTFTCGLLMNGSVACWGALTGICSSGGPPALLKLPSSVEPAPFLDIASGVSHVCGLQRNGTVLCYGDACVPSPSPSSLFQAISSGANFSCGVLRTGALQCWGDGTNAAVGASLPVGTGFVEVAAGAAHACALIWNGSVACWGDNSGGAVSPIVSGSYIWLSCGINFSCGILDGGASPNVINCWGAPLARTIGTFGYSAVEISCWNGECIYVNKNGAVPKQIDSQIVLPLNMNSVSVGISSIALAVSADGSRLVASNNGFSFTSADFGGTWVGRKNQNWVSIASSSDGSRLVAAVDGGYIYTSWDFGVTWAQREASRNWRSVASSSNGSNLVAAEYDQYGRIRISSDYGASWTQHGTSEYWCFVASSGGGHFAAAPATRVDAVLLSSDFGATWIESRLFGTLTITSLALSSNGSCLIAVSRWRPEYIYISSNFGASWMQTGTRKYWSSVALSSDGGKQAAASDSSGGVHTSSDFGVTWLQQRGVQTSCSAVALSSSGSFVAASCSGYLFTSCVAYSPDCAPVSFSGPALDSLLSRGDAITVWRMVSVGNTLPSLIGAVNLTSVPHDSLTQTNLLGWNTAIVPLDFSSFASLSSLVASAFSSPVFGRCTKMYLPVGNSRFLQLFPGAFDGLSRLLSINSASTGTFDFSGTGVWAAGYAPGSFNWAVLQGLPAIPTLILNGLGEGANSITSIVPTQPAQLPLICSRLTALSLQNNALTNLDSTYFAGFTALKALALDSNNISFARSNTITSFQQPNLLTLTFANNPLPASPCPPSYYNSITSVSAGGQLPACFVCSIGFVCPGDGTAHPCPSGFYNNLPGKTSVSSDCLPCPIGTYNELTGQSILGCVNCIVGTSSNAVGSNSSSSCAPCRAGSYAGGIGLALCQLCPQGMYNNATGATSSAFCVSCPLNTFSAVAGATSLANCTPCAPGTFTTATGSYLESQCAIPVGGCGTAGTYCDRSIAKPCPLGNYCPAGATAPTQCPIGTWGASNSLSTSACSGSCSVGSFGTIAGAQSEPAACQKCAAGSSVNFFGATSCYLCAPGTYSDVLGAAQCTSCAAGRYNNAVGSNTSAACLSCPQGTYGLVPGSTLSGCTACAVGTASAALFATSPDACVACRAGFIAAAPGSTACTPCSAGSFSAAPYTSCSLCEFGTFALAPGSEQCSPCPNGTMTSGRGATNAAQCVRGGFPGCPLETQPRGTYTPQQSGDCIPLVCLPPLARAADNTTCVDPCGPGSVYQEVTGACIACGAQQICPGFSVSFLSSDPSGSVANGSASSAAGGLLGSAPSSLAASAAVDSCASQDSSNAGNLGMESLSGSSAAAPSSTTWNPAIVAVVAGGCVVVVSVALLAALSHCYGSPSDAAVGKGEASATSSEKGGDGALPSSGGCCCQCGWQSCSTQFLEAIDLFSVRTPKLKGEATINLPTALGGLCSVAGIVTIVCLALVSIIRRNQDNVTSVSALAVLDPTTLQNDLKLPVTPSSPTSTMSGAAWTGLRIRIFSSLPPASPSSSAANGAAVTPPCAARAPIPDSYLSGGLVSGGWVMSSVSDCGVGATAAMILTCANCVFSSTSFLTVALPWQCQSLSIDAAAVSATGTLSTASIPYAATSALQDALLRNVTWSIAPVLDMLDDQIVSSKNRGLRLISLAQSTIRTPTGASNLTILPASASITLSFLLPLQGYYSSTVRTEKVSTLQLLASVVGLAGLLGAFRILHTLARQVKGAPMAAATILRLRRASGRAAASVFKGKSNRSLVASSSPLPTETVASGAAVATSSTLNPINTAAAATSRTSLVPLPVLSSSPSFLPPTSSGAFSSRSLPASHAQARDALQLRLEQRAMQDKQEQQLTRQEQQIMRQEQQIQQLQLQQERVKELEQRMQQLLPARLQPSALTADAAAPILSVPSAPDARGLRAQSITATHDQSPSFSTVTVPSLAVPPTAQQSSSTDVWE